MHPSISKVADISKKNLHNAQYMVVLDDYITYDDGYDERHHSNTTKYFTVNLFFDTEVALTQWIKEHKVKYNAENFAVYKIQPLKVETSIQIKLG